METKVQTVILGDCIGTLVGKSLAKRGGTWSPKTQTLNPKPETQPELQTLNPTWRPMTLSLFKGVYRDI